MDMYEASPESRALLAVSGSVDWRDHDRLASFRSAVQMGPVEMEIVKNMAANSGRRQ